MVQSSCLQSAATFSHSYHAESPAGARGRAGSGPLPGCCCPLSWPHFRLDAVSAHGHCCSTQGRRDWLRRTGPATGPGPCSGCAAAMMRQPCGQPLTRRPASSANSALPVPHHSLLHIATSLFVCSVLQMSVDMRQAQKIVSALAQREAWARHAAAFCLFPA